MKKKFRIFSFWICDLWVGSCNYEPVTGTHNALFCSSSTAALICVLMCVMFTPAGMTAAKFKTKFLCNFWHFYWFAFQLTWNILPIVGFKLERMFVHFFCCLFADFIFDFFDLSSRFEAQQQYNRINLDSFQTFNRWNADIQQTMPILKLQ